MVVEARSLAERKRTIIDVAIAAGYEKLARQAEVTEAEVLPAFARDGSLIGLVA